MSAHKCTFSLEVGSFVILTTSVLTMIMEDCKEEGLQSLFPPPTSPTYHKRRTISLWKYLNKAQNP